jgi:hypothetical protein
LLVSLIDMLKMPSVENECYTISMHNNNTNYNKIKMTLMEK